MHGADGKVRFEETADPSGKKLAKRGRDRRRVLAHMSGMLTTQEVAMDMYVSVNTVKTHARNIFRKIEARRRRARQLGLL